MESNAIERPTPQTGAEWLERESEALLSRYWAVDLLLGSPGPLNSRQRIPHPFAIRASRQVRPAGECSAGIVTPSMADAASAPVGSSRFFGAGFLASDAREALLEVDPCGRCLCRRARVGQAPWNLRVVLRRLPLIPGKFRDAKFSRGSLCNHPIAHRRNISEPDAQLALMLLVFVVLGVCLYLVVARFHVRGAQLLEAALYFLVIAAAVVAPLVRRFTTNDSRKKRAPFVVRTDKDEREVEAAWKQNAVLLGYDMDEKPWIWPDEVRVMQGIVLGMTGSGKTTLLKNIIAQDLARFTGPPEDRHRIPMVIFDGKGDLEFFE